MSQERGPQRSELKSVISHLHKAGVDTEVVITYQQMYERFQTILNNARQLKKLSDEALKIGYTLHEASFSKDIMGRCVDLADIVAILGGEAGKLGGMTRRNATFLIRSMNQRYAGPLADAELKCASHPMLIARLTEWIKEIKNPKP